MTYDQIIGRLRVMQQKEMQRGFPSKVQQSRIDEINSLIDEIRDSQSRASNGMSMASYSLEEIRDVVVGYLGNELILAHPNRQAVKIKVVERAFTFRPDNTSDEAIYNIIKLRKVA